MRSGFRSVALIFTAGLLLAFDAPSQAGTGPLYMNNYGSGWGVWLRGHAVLKETVQDYVLEVERISVEPNRAYPQSFEISGFKLSYYFTDKESGEPLNRDAVAGPSAPYPARLDPTRPLIIENITIAVGKPVRPEVAESLVLELHVITASGASIGVWIGEFFDK